MPPPMRRRDRNGTHSSGGSQRASPINQSNKGQPPGRSELRVSVNAHPGPPDCSSWRNRRDSGRARTSSSTGVHNVPRRESYILKSAPVEAIISAVKATAAGESVLSSQIAGKLLQRIRELDIPVKTSAIAAVAIRTALTDRELEIFKRLSSGKSNHEIARDLSLSPNTVANHVAGILAKLHVENRIQAAVEAVRSGIS